jgi:hypothetical protein
VKEIYFPPKFPYSDLEKLGYTKKEWTIRAVRLRKIADDVLASERWKRKGNTTYCGQYALSVLKEFGCDLSKLTEGRDITDINTTMSYYNCIENGVYEIIDSEGKPDPIMAFYIARFGVPVDVLSPYDLVIDGKHYNHSLLIYPEFWTEFLELLGPPIIQEGWKGFRGYMGDPYAYGDDWDNERIKYFVLPMK